MDKLSTARVTPSSETKEMTNDTPVSWPNPSLESAFEFPEDLVAILDHEPLSPALRISRGRGETSGKHEWKIEHPTRVQVRNLEELVNEPEEVMAAIEARFSLLGNIYRIEDLWLDNFGIEGLFTISFAEERSADAACMLGVVRIETLVCTFSVTSVKYDIDQVKLIRREDPQKRLDSRRAQTLRRLEARVP